MKIGCRLMHTHVRYFSNVHANEHENRLITFERFSLLLFFLITYYTFYECVIN